VLWSIDDIVEINIPLTCEALIKYCGALIKYCGGIDEVPIKYCGALIRCCGDIAMLSL
jgi:hypothetical protein